MYKLIAIDLDGTLLNSYGIIPEENRKAIKKAQEAGINVVLASGRTTNSVKSLAEELGGNEYIICGNGSLIYDLKKEEIIYDKFIEKTKALQIIQICEQNSIYYNVYTEDMVIAKTLDNNVLFYHQENANKPDSKKTKINLVDNIYEYVRNLEGKNLVRLEDLWQVIELFLEKLRLKPSFLRALHYTILYLHLLALVLQLLFLQHNFHIIFGLELVG